MSSAGDRSIVTNPHKREELRQQGKLYTGKTEKKNNRAIRAKQSDTQNPKGKK